MLWTRWNSDAGVTWVSLGDNSIKNGGDHFYSQSATMLSQEIFLNNNVKEGEQDPWSHAFVYMQIRLGDSKEKQVGSSSHSN